MAGNKPDYIGDGIVVWKNKTTSGKEYLMIQLFGKNGIRIVAYKVENYPK